MTVPCECASQNVQALGLHGDDGTGETSTQNSLTSPCCSGGKSDLKTLVPFTNRSLWPGSLGTFYAVITVTQQCGSQSSSVSLSPSWCTSMTITSCTTDKRPTDDTRKRAFIIFATLPPFWEVAAAHTSRRLIMCFLLCKASFFNPCLSLKTHQLGVAFEDCARFERDIFGPLRVFLPVFSA